MLVAFKFGSLSVLHPMLSLSYIFALVFGKLFLGEYISVLKILGIASIIVGVAFIGGGDE